MQPRLEDCKRCDGMANDTNISCEGFNAQWGKPQNWIGMKLIMQQSQAINEMFEKSVRNNATPPIRGPITKGKLAWRGISMHTDVNGTQWIEQRGMQISNKVQISFIITQAK